MLFVSPGTLFTEPNKDFATQQSSNPEVQDKSNSKEFKAFQKHCATINKYQRTMNVLGSAVTAIKPRNDESIIDRMNYYYSTVIIMVMSLTISAKQYVGQPIQCWVPAHFSRAHEQYAEGLCVVQNTYWVSPHEHIPELYEDRINQQLKYYQWIPFLMALQAIFFYVPILFWGAMNNRSALNISNVIRLAEVATNTEDAEREKHIAAMCTHLDDAYRLQMNYRKTASPWERVYKFGFFDGSFVRNMYIITKLLFVINVIGQFYMMNFFLGQNSSTWGIKLLSDLTNGKDWDDSGNFPRVTMCDFDVRILGNIQRYTIQCVLVLNMFNEKIFLFLYWWFLVVGFMTAVEGCFWIFETQMTTSRIVYAKKHVQVERNEEHLFQQFCDVKLNADGILILRLISSHTNDLIVKDVLKILWELYKSKASLESVAIVSTLHEYPETVKNSYMILDSSPPGERYFRRDELSTPLIEDRKRNSKCD